MRQHNGGGDQTIDITTYNVRSACQESLEILLWALKPMKLDIGVLIETHLQGFHTTNTQDLEVFATHTE